MIYVDHVHMVADSLKELHSFAASNCINRSYFEGVRKGHPHYDVIGWRRDKAIQNGAIVVDSKTILLKSKQMR